jgi:murein DD-endopeptidase MepM/ murein hydrolase activator NlpD
MSPSTAKRVLAVALPLILGAIVATTTYLPAVRAQAQTPPPTEKPFIPPFKGPPGPATWLLVQPYGNTSLAYQQRNSLYRLSGGIHFGIDLGAPCGTDVVAIADGVVFEVDNLNYGSAPHNLIIDHLALKYSSLYGHLLERPALTVGQRVKQGDVIARSGDPAGSACYGRPHLHLEIRDANHSRKFNPVTLIRADWDNVSLIGPFGAGFEYNLDNPRQWQHLDDQPEAVSQGPILNDFKNPWPPDWRAWVK